MSILLQRRDGVKLQQSGGCETEGAECSPGNSFVNSWVERTRGEDPNRKCSPDNPFRNAWVDSSNAGASKSMRGAYPNMEFFPGIPEGIGLRAVRHAHPNMAALLRRQRPDDSGLRMPVPINSTELLAHRAPVKRHCPGIEVTPCRY